MSWRPAIQTALPKRRYQYGEFTAVLLTEIETADPCIYHHVFAIIKDGSHNPDVYIINQTTAEQIHQIVVVSSSGTQPVHTSEQPLTVDAFCEFALSGMSQMFGLSDETPNRLL